MFRCDEIEAFERRWGNALTLEETMTRLGVATKKLTLDLIQVGLIKAERSPQTYEHATWLFERESVILMVDNLKQHVGDPAGAPGKLINLHQAVELVEAMGLNGAAILQVATCGRLHLYLARKCRFSVAHLRFLTSEIQALGAETKEARNWLNVKEVAQRMGVKQTVVAKWVRNGLLRPATTYANAQHYSREGVQEFAANHVFSEEDIKILGVGQLVVQKWTRNERLNPVASKSINGCHRYLFRREDVERLRPKNRLTAPQLAKKLGLSRSQMSEWIRQGKVKPISGPGIDGCKHYLFTQDFIEAGPNQ